MDNAPQSAPTGPGVAPPATRGPVDAAVEKKVPLPRDILTSHVVKKGMHRDHRTREQAGAE